MVYISTMPQYPPSSCPSLLPHFKPTFALTTQGGGSFCDSRPRINNTICTSIAEPLEQVGQSTARVIVSSKDGSHNLERSQTSGHITKLATTHSIQTNNTTTMADIHTPIPNLKLNDGTSIPMVSPTANTTPKSTISPNSPKTSPTNTTPS
jgi:hypothetical protein